MKNIILLLIVLTGSSSALAKSMEPISVDIKEESVVNVVRNIANIYKFNVVLPDSATKKEVSVLVKNVAPDELLNAIARASGYRLNIQAGIYIFTEMQSPSVTACPCEQK